MDQTLTIIAVLAVAAIALLGLGIVSVRRQELAMRLRIDAVEAAEAEVRRLLDELPEAVLLVDADGVVRSTNAAALGMFDLARRELVDTHLVDLASGEDHVRLAAAMRRATEGDAVDPIQIEMHSSDRRVVFVEASFHLPRSAESAAAPSDDRRVVVRLRDVSEREQQQRALDQARRRFQQAFQSAPTGMALVRVDDGRIVDANQSLAEMLRRDVNELVGCTLREFTHPDDVRAAQPHRARL